MKIELKNVSKKFDKSEVLKNVNLTFEKGNIYGFVGRNGSGKSVLLKLICAFYEPSSGLILFDGENIIANNKYPPSTRALIEKPTFIPDLTGLENLMLLASIQNIINEVQILETLKLVDLYEEKDKKYHKYSLGMKQKLGIAQVLMENPEVLILDEAFNGLDNASSDKIRKLILDEKKKGKIVIIASHIKEDIVMLCDKVYELDDGNISLISKEKVNV